MLPILSPDMLKLFWPKNVKKSPTFRPQEIIPEEVVADFFDIYTLETIRQDLWELFKYALNNEAPTDPLTVSDFIFLYERLNDLITVNYIQFEQMEAAKKKAEADKNLDK
jgi:hypothetical protein